MSPNIVSHLTEKRNLSELLFCEIELDCKNKALNVEQKDWLNAAGIYVLFKTISADEIKIKSLLQETFR